MSRRLQESYAQTPDDHCCGCGRGIFYEGALPLNQINSFGTCSELEDADYWMHLCGLCYQIEAECIKQQGKTNPERVEAYRRMHERTCHG